MGYNLSPKFSDCLVRRFTVPGMQPGIQLDQFIHVCIKLQSMTQAFRERDTNMTGNIHISYEDFLLGAVTRLAWAPWQLLLLCGYSVTPCSGHGLLSFSPTHTSRSTNGLSHSPETFHCFCCYKFIKLIKVPKTKIPVTIGPSERSNSSHRCLHECDNYCLLTSTW